MFCWASSLGSCRGGQSGEHIVSASVFSTQTILVSGPIWRAQTPKLIGLASATANILCSDHNSRLSPVDEAAGQAMRALRAFMEFQELRRHLAGRRWTGILRSRLNGPLFERFLIKTLVNMTVARDPGYVLTGSTAFDQPALALVEAAFGVRTLKHPAGLYFHANTTDTITSNREGLEALSLVANGTACVGAAFLFRGFPFFLWLDEALPPQSFPPFPLKALLHRPRLMEGKVGGLLSHELLFEGWA